jgi:hypothetical protein
VALACAVLNIRKVLKYKNIVLNGMIIITENTYDLN